MKVFVLGSYVSAHSLTLSRLPQLGESLEALEVWSEHGGKGLNVAVGLHRLGVEVAVLIATGQDQEGRNLREVLLQEGMNADYVMSFPGRSGFGIGLIGPNAQNWIAICAGANGLLSPQHIQSVAQTLQQTQLVYAQFEIPEAPILTAFQLARASGTKTLLNPSPWRLPSQALLQVTDYLIVNEREAGCWLNLSSLPESPQLWLNLLRQLQPFEHWSGQVCIVTLGEQGCIAWRRGESEPCHIAGYPVQVSDTTGAGDAFSAGFVWAHSTGFEWLECLKLANACGAQVVSRLGVLAALPRLEELLRFRALY